MVFFFFFGSLPFPFFAPGAGQTPAPNVIVEREEGEEREETTQDVLHFSDKITDHYYQRTLHIKPANKVNTLLQLYK